MTRPCCKCSRCGSTFLCTNGEMENGYCSQHVLDYLFPDICGQRTMTKKGAKRNVPYLLQAQQAPVCLWSISETLQCRKKVTIPAWLYGLGISRRGRINLHERKCKDQVSNPGPLALKSHTILAALSVLGICRRGRNDLHERKCPDRVSNPGPLAHHIGCAIWPGCPRPRSTVGSTFNSRTQSRRFDTWFGHIFSFLLRQIQEG